MAVARQIDCLVGDGTAVARSVEVCESAGEFLDYCESQGLCTRIAFQNGDSGSGTDWSVGSAGDDCFACYRFDQGTGEDFYILIQAANTASFGGSPGNPGRLAQNQITGFGIAMAVRRDGLSPWNGTTNNDGTDTKGDPVWVGGDDPPFVFPMSNNAAPASTTLADYDHATSKENMALAGSFSGGSGYHRGGFWANEECFYIEWDAQNNGAYTYQTACGRYTPHSHMAATCLYPYFMISSESSNTGVFELGPAATPPPFHEYGSRDGNQGAGSTPGEGGVVAKPDDGVIRVQCNVLQATNLNTTYQPNQLYPTDRYELTPFVLNAYEHYPIHSFGALGWLPSEVVAYSVDVPVNETNAAATIAVFGDTSATVAKAAKSWDGGAAPSAAGNTTGTPTGRQSFTP